MMCRDTDWCTTCENIFAWTFGFDDFQELFKEELDYDEEGHLPGCRFLAFPFLLQNPRLSPRDRKKYFAYISVFCDMEPIACASAFLCQAARLRALALHRDLAGSIA